MIQDVTFIHSDSGHAKADKPRENEAKTKRRRLNMDKKGGKSHFGYKLHSIIDRDYELIRILKTTILLLHDYQVD